MRSPQAIPGIHTIYEGMKLNKQFVFFTYLLENYAVFKKTTADEILRTLDKNNLTDFVFDMYEMYHSESIDNAFTDLDSLIKTGKPAW